MQRPRAEHTAVRIPNNGNVLLIGGSASGQFLASTELFDAVALSFTEVGSLTAARANIAAAAQGDGGVILAIGGSAPRAPPRRAASSKLRFSVAIALFTPRGFPNHCRFRLPPG